MSSRINRLRWAALVAVVGLTTGVPAGARAEGALVPKIEGSWWTVAGDPDLGPLTHEKQQPVDFAVWQAADGSWQLWSCIRGTKCGGNTRLFYRWQGDKLTDADWRPMGIAMQADPAFGETPGGLQAPHVVKVEGSYQMFYGDWKHICVATGMDGKTFARQLTREGVSGMFGESGEGDVNSRDAMVLRAGDRWHCYYTAHPGRKGAVYCRTSDDLRSWSESKIVAAGGAAGDGPFSSECPHVVHLPEDGMYYLFRTQRYGAEAVTTVYRSDDPLDFGVNDDAKMVCRLPIAAPEIVHHDGEYYVAALLPSLKGIQVARLKWVEGE